MGGGLASVTLGVDREAKPGLILLKLILIQGSLPESYIYSGRGTPGLSFLTDIAFMGCIHASLSSRGTPALLNKPKIRNAWPKFILASLL